eukprot:UN04220
MPSSVFSWNFIDPSHLVLGIRCGCFTDNSTYLPPR